MNINERIKCLRKELNLNQEDFGEKVGIARGHMANIETGRREVTEKTLKVICLQFNVNEEWLRYGTGDVFIETDETIIAELANQYHLDEIEKLILAYFLKLPKDKRKILKSCAYMLADMVIDNDKLYSDYEKEVKGMLSFNLTARGGLSALKMSKEEYEQSKQDVKNEPDCSDDRDLF